MPAIKGDMYINTHCNYSQPTLIKLYNENIGRHLTPLHPGSVIFGRLGLQLCLNRETLRWNSFSCHRETSRIDRQWLWDHAIKFATWRHPAMGCGVRLVVPCTIYFSFFLNSVFILILFCFESFLFRFLLQCSLLWSIFNFRFRSY